MVQGLTPFKPGKVIAGLTGVYGCGKSTVARLFEELGAFRVDADLIAHEALMKGSEVYESLAAVFPEAAGPAGDLDRKTLAGIVFDDPGRRKKLEALVHPYVLQRMAEEAADAAEAVVILEIPLLFETGFDRYCSPNMVVKAKKEVILGRLEGKGVDAGMAGKRWDAQLAAEEKEKRADIVIDNSESIQETKRQVEQVWKKHFLERSNTTSCQKKK